MATEFPSEIPSYPMNGESNGYGVIIINTFNHISSHRRQGTDNEKQSFQKLFLSIGLEPLIFEDLKKNEILSKLQEISQNDKLKEHTMIAIAIRCGKVSIEFKLFCSFQEIINLSGDGRHHRQVFFMLII